MPYDKERYANDPIYRGNRQKAQRRWREAKRLKINAQKREDYAANPAVDPGLDQLSQQLPHRKEPAALGHRGRPVLFAAGTPLQNAALMWQRLEGAPDFLTNFGGGRADSDPFPGFPLRSRKSDRWKIPPRIQWLAHIGEKISSARRIFRLHT